MADKKLTIRVFLSSPGDVAAERKIAREILTGLNDNPFVRDKVTVEVLAWEAPGSRVLMPVSLTPQEAIDRKLAKPSQTDATIVILWGRMGTPLDVEKHGKKPNGDPFWSGTEWEYLDAVAGTENHPKRLPIVLVYRRTDTPPYPDDDDPDVLIEFATQRKRVNQFFEDFRGKAGEYRKSHTEYTSPDDFREQFMQDALLLVKELLALHTDAPDIETEEPEVESIRIVWKGSPFPGLRAFTQDDEPIFFGRGYETADLIKRLSKQRLMFVVGASGSGKSSLVAAGVLPQIQRGAVYGVAGWHIVRFTPGDAPFKRLAAALLRHMPVLYDAMADDEERAAELAALFQRSPDKLSKQVEKWLRDDPDGTEVLLFIDQFEELYTTTPEDQRAAFAAMLQVVSPQIRTIATLRSDFYEQALSDFETVLRDATYTLSTPSRYALREMIERPAAVTGLMLDDDLPALIVDATAGQAGNLALMAYTLDELYERASDGRITRAVYEALGGVQGAIGTRAEAIYAGLSDDETVKTAWMQRVFHELVSVDERGTATRRRVPLEQIHEEDRDWADAFVKARLLTAGIQGDVPVLEVAHEALFRNWERLRDWIAEAQEDLILLRQVRNAAQDWDEQDRPDFLLWPQERLELVYAMLDRLQPELSDVVQAFIESEQARLLRELEDIDVTHARRLAIGERLDAIGDTRRGVGLREDGLPDIVWCYVDVPSYLRGKPIQFWDEDGNIYAKKVIEPFWVAKYMLTYQQVQAFEVVMDDPRWWQGMAQNYNSLNDQHIKFGNNPRDSINWYQAMAITRWLDMVLPEDAYPEAARTGYQTRLLWDWEWQWMAQGGIAEKEYPWGEWDERKCNTSEAGLNRPTAVGMYPHGKADCGALDVVGQLSTWCLNEYGGSALNLDAKSNRRVLRGGACDFSQRYARCALRLVDALLDVYHYGVVCARAVPVPSL